MKLQHLPLLLAAGIALTLSAAENNGFALHKGDRVVFYGDSITDQRLYTTFTETYVVTRFPEMNVTFVHSGWGGDRVSGGGGGNIDTRLDRDVIAYKPTVMTIMLGMNDASYRAYDEGIFNKYSTGYEHIISKVKAALPGIRFTLIQPSPFDDVTRAPNFEGGYNKVLVRYGEFVKQLSEREHAGLADLNTSVVEALTKAKATDAKTAEKLIPDRVHPAAAGQLLMAEALLKAWNAPALVASVELDAQSGKVLAAENTKVADLKTDGTLRWKQTDKALPMPVDLNDPVVSLAVKSSDFMESLNQQPLKVTGLTGAKYRLTIDTNEVGTLSKEQLETGVNLASLPTPMAKQAMDVHKLTLQHNEAHFIRWRQVQMRFATNAPNIKEAFKGLDAFENALVKQQRDTAKPRTHSFELRPE